LPVTIEAQVQSGDEHQVFFDPAFTTKFEKAEATGNTSVRAQGLLNGGGEVIRLRTAGGNIKVVLSDTSKQLQIYRQQMDQMEKNLATQLHLVPATGQTQNQ
jgi:hypothetical protein